MPMPVFHFARTGARADSPETCSLLVLSHVHAFRLAVLTLSTSAFRCQLHGQDGYNLATHVQLSREPLQGQLGALPSLRGSLLCTS